MEADEQHAVAASNAATQLQAQPVDQPAGDGTGSRKKKDKHVYHGRRQMDDSFMMYLYKVKLCTRQTTHNWKLCPWAHPGETAALRRHPNCHSAELCPAVRMNQECPHGEACTYSRNAFECWLHPDRYRTTMCSMGEACNRNICFFAHNASELRHPVAAALDDESAQRPRVQLQFNMQQQQQPVMDAAPVSPRMLNPVVTGASIVAQQEAGGAAGVPAQQGLMSSDRAGVPALVMAEARGASSSSSSIAAAAATAAATQLSYPLIADMGGYATYGEYGCTDDRSPGLGERQGSTSSRPVAAAALGPTARSSGGEVPQDVRSSQLSALEKQHQLQLAKQQGEHGRQMLALQMMVLQQQQDNAVMHLKQAQDRETAALMQQLQEVTIDEGAAPPQWLQQRRQQLAAAAGAGMEAQQQQGRMFCEGGSSGMSGNPGPAHLVLSAPQLHQANAVRSMCQFSSPPQFQQPAGQQLAMQQQQQLAFQSSIVQMQQLAAAAQQQQLRMIDPQVVPLGQQTFLGSPRVQQQAYGHQQQQIVQLSPMLQQVHMPDANSLHISPAVLAVCAAQPLPPVEPQQQQPLQLLSLPTLQPGQHGLWR